VCPTVNPAPDAGVLGRIQQDNQRQILGKLLHDLRNPVHSIRISMELFGRLARRKGDLDKLMERAAAYIEPAEAAIESLVVNSERLGKYLAAPAAAQIAPTPVGPLLAEVTALVRAARRKLHVTCSISDADATLKIQADRVRLSHLLLHRCLNNAAANVAIAVSRDGDDSARIDLVFSGAGADDGTISAPLDTAEIRLLGETAGGSMAAASADALALSFRCWRAPPPA
jgi:hypothetical protein